MRPFKSRSNRLFQQLLQPCRKRQKIWALALVTNAVRAVAKAICGGGLFRRAEARRFHRGEGHFFCSNQIAAEMVARDLPQALKRIFDRELLLHAWKACSIPL